VRSARAASRCATALSAAAAALVRLARSLSAAVAAFSLRKEVHADGGVYLKTGHTMGAMTTDATLSVANECAWSATGWTLADSVYGMQLDAMQWKISTQRRAALRAKASGA
jgi:hypothetical protein